MGNTYETHCLKALSLQHRYTNSRFDQKVVWSSLREKCLNTEVFVVGIFLYSGWISRIQSKFRKIRTRKKERIRHFSRSASMWISCKHPLKPKKAMDSNNLACRKLMMNVIKKLMRIFNYLSLSIKFKVTAMYNKEDITFFFKKIKHGGLPKSSDIWKDFLVDQNMFYVYPKLYYSILRFHFWQSSFYKTYCSSFRHQ